MSDELVEIGYVIKTHGVKGHLRIAFNENIKELSVSEALYFLVKGVQIPFFIQEIEYFKDGDATIKLEEFSNKEEAEFYTKKKIFGPTDYLTYKETEEEIPYLDYKVIDEMIGELGIVKGYHNMGDYELAEIDFNGRDLMIPLHDDIILEKDDQNKIIHVRLPDGLVDL